MVTEARIRAKNFKTQMCPERKLERQFLGDTA